MCAPLFLSLRHLFIPISRHSSAMTVLLRIPDWLEQTHRKLFLFLVDYGTRRWRNLCVAKSATLGFYTTQHTEKTDRRIDRGEDQTYTHTQQHHSRRRLPPAAEKTLGDTHSKHFRQVDWRKKLERNWGGRKWKRRVEKKSERVKRKKERKQYYTEKE